MGIEGKGANNEASGGGVCFGCCLYVFGGAVG